MGAEQDLKVIGIAGSLRKASFNAGVLRAAQRLAPEGLSIEVVDLSTIPLYNEDVRANGFPPPVEHLRSRIKAADGLLIATPEYNYSVPGVLKNAIDWASRPPEQPFEGKPIGILGASVGAQGSGRAQYHLRQVFIYLNGFVMNRPEVMIPGAAQKFNDQAELTDGATTEHLTAYLQAFKAWVTRIKTSA